MKQIKIRKVGKQENIIITLCTYLRTIEKRSWSKPISLIQGQAGQVIIDKVQLQT